MALFNKRIIEESLQKEADALRQLANNPPKNLYSALDLIYDCTGKIIFIGVGKSAIVAQKIAASFNSIGKSALFLHAGDALHGDLGSIQTKDLIFVLSRSGQTLEICTLLNAIKSHANKIIAVVNNSNSEIANLADLTIHVDQDKEADPLNIVPTISTLLQMAIGDALTVALMVKENINSNQFKRFHPAGNIGFKLNLLVQDVNNLKAKPRVKFNSSLDDVIIEISSGKMGATAVFDKNDRVIGIITDGDLRRMLLENKTHKDDVTASDIMSNNPKTIASDLLAQEALEIMKSNKITQLIIVDGVEYKGIIHMHELLQIGLF